MRAQNAGAQGLVVSCPTCAYTYAKELWAQRKGESTRFEGFRAHNYLELVFNWRIDWESVFSRLENMWTGEYAAWVASQLL
jgi:hypothetical protein